MDSARQDHKSISGQKLLLQQYSVEDLLAERQRLLQRLKECEQLDTELSARMMNLISIEGMAGQQEASPILAGLITGGNHYV